MRRYVSFRRKAGKCFRRLRSQSKAGSMRVKCSKSACSASEPSRGIARRQRVARNRRAIKLTLADCTLHVHQAAARGGGRLLLPERTAPLASRGFARPRRVGRLALRTRAPSPSGVPCGYLGLSNFDERGKSGFEQLAASAIDCRRQVLVPGTGKHILEQIGKPAARTVVCRKHQIRTAKPCSCASTGRSAAGSGNSRGQRRGRHTGRAVSASLDRKSARPCTAPSLVSLIGGAALWPAMAFSATLDTARRRGARVPNLYPLTLQTTAPQRDATATRTSDTTTRRT